MDSSNGDYLINFLNSFNDSTHQEKNTIHSLNQNSSSTPAMNIKENKSQALNACKKNFIKSLFNDDRNDNGSTGASDKNSNNFGSESNSSNCNESSMLTEHLSSLNLNGLSSGSNPNSLLKFTTQTTSKVLAPSSSNNTMLSFNRNLIKCHNSNPFTSSNSSSSSQSSSEPLTPRSMINNRSFPTTTNIYSNQNHCDLDSIINFQKSSINQYDPSKCNHHITLNSLDVALDSLLSSSKSATSLTSNCNNALKNEAIENLIVDEIFRGSNYPSNDADLFKNRRNLTNSEIFSSGLENHLSNESKSFVLNDSSNDSEIFRSIDNFKNFISNTDSYNSFGAISPFTKNQSTVSSITSLQSPISSNVLSTEISDLQIKSSASDSTRNSSPFTTLSTLNNNQLMTRFDYQIRIIANEINSTVQLYQNSIQMRKEQLLKQLDHVRNSYSILLGNYNAVKNQQAFQQLPKISFTRPDQNLFKSITSLGFIHTPAFAPNCVVSGEGLSMAIEGEPTCFSISTRNCFNEEILMGGESIEIDIQPKEYINQLQNSFIQTAFHIQKNILDNNNGKYNVTYMIPRGSSLRTIKISISVNGLVINQNSPFIATVKTERLREKWKLISVYGEEGSEPGKFCRPWGIAITRLPLVKDSNHKLIDDNSNFSTIPINSQAFYTWISPNYRKDYLLAVADRSNNRIQLLKLSIFEDSSKQFIQTNVNKVEISVLHVFGSGPGTRPGMFDRPAGIAINNNISQLIVADKDNHRIQVFDLSGNFLFKFGEKGSRPGQFCYPWDVAVCSKTSMILVSDTRNRRIQLFTHYGQFLWHCAHPLDSPRGVVFLTPDRYIISDFNKHRLLIIDRNESSSHSSVNNHQRDDLIAAKYIGFGEGSAWGEFLRPQGLVAQVQNNNNSANKYLQILCADSRNNRIAIYNSLNQNFEYINEETSKSENLANIASSFDRPSGIAISENILAVVDFGNNRLQIFQKNLV
ncbi:Filamin and NHL repeat containing protein [Sarcoptes scabiei]|uniref:Filamin and NHL repeat containing protein n=1 Tax=Sarcoptes scabiei TaxID=52283 RepID=A0A131ZVH1_SARSC|nr:Filamin and NHL repeat containing protein [Sarcoptes scabiei]